MRVRAVFDKPDLVMQPGLFGIINIPGSLPYEGVLIPDSAISADQDRRIVYRVDGEGKVSPQQIRPGPRMHGYRVVRDGRTGVRKSTRLNSRHSCASRMPSTA